MSVQQSLNIISAYIACTCDLNVREHFLAQVLTEAHNH